MGGFKSNALSAACLFSTTKQKTMACSCEFAASSYICYEINVINLQDAIYVFTTYQTIEYSQ